MHTLAAGRMSMGRPSSSLIATSYMNTDTLPQHNDKIGKGNVRITLDEYGEKVR
jgi:hypothetical protein